MKFSIQKSLAAAAVPALVLGLSVSTALAGVRASVNQDKVAIGDSFSLSIETDGQSPDAAPDLSPLSRDFEVRGTSQNMQTSIVNGRTSVSRGWTIQLAPRSEGKLTIPAVRIGQEKTSPLSIDVVATSALPKAELASGGLQVDMSAPQGPYYVNQEIPVTVRVLDAIGLRDARLSDVGSPDFVARQAGDDKVSQAERGGKPVTVIERTYLVTPQKSGNLTLPPVVLEGSVADPDARSSPFDNMFRNDPAFAQMRQRFGMPSMSGSLFDDMFNAGRPVRIRSQALALAVRAAQTSQAGEWFLPAKKVVLNAAWQPEAPSFKAGEAVTRIVQLVAVGASKEKLPDIALRDTDSLRMYVDRVDDRTETTADGSAAIKQFTVSVVPEHGGQIVVPEIDVAWFDTQSGTRKTATLPAETIIVEGSPRAAGNATAPDNNEEKVAGPAGDGEPGIALSATFLTWVAGGIAAALASVLALAIILRQRRTRAPGRHEGRNTVTPGRDVRARRVEAVRDAERAVLDACRRGDAAAALNAIQMFFAVISVTPHQVLSRGGGTLAADIADLEALLYDPTASHGSWSGEALARSFSAWRTSKRGSVTWLRRTGDLPPLYAPVEAGLVSA